MTGAAEDMEAELGMVIRHYGELAIKSPGHELLGLGKLHDDRLGITFSPDYDRRCVRDTDKFRIQGYMRLNSALEDALAGRQFRLLDTTPPCDR